MDIYRCDNPKCRMPQPTHLCPKCGIAYYCSIRCQLAGWRAGHKDTCIAIKPNKEKALNSKIEDQSLDEDQTKLSDDDYAEFRDEFNETISRFLLPKGSQKNNNEAFIDIEESIDEYVFSIICYGGTPWDYREENNLGVRDDSGKKYCWDTIACMVGSSLYQHSDERTKILKETIAYRQLVDRLQPTDILAGQSSKKLTRAAIYKIIDELCAE